MKKIILALIGFFMTEMCLGGIFSLYVLIRYADFKQGKVFVITLPLLIIAGSGLAAFKCFKALFRYKKTAQKHETVNSPITEIPIQPLHETHPEHETISAPPTMGVNIMKTEVPKEMDTYAESRNMIYRTDGKPISDEEVPYLIQAGYEKALQKEGVYEGQVLDLSFMQKQDKNKKEYTRIPSYDELSMVEPSESTICSTDIFFLKYIDGQCLEHPSIAQYWYYDYNLNYSEEIKKLISIGLLTISNININKFKVDELKKILKHFNLPLTGKKHDLQERILSKISTYDLSDYLGNEINYFCATEKGKTLIDSIRDSATKNLELENDCIDLILTYDFETALSLIKDFKSKTPTGSSAYPHFSNHVYAEIMDNSPFFYTLTKDRDIEQRIRAGIVFCRMYGCGLDNIHKLIKRIYADNNKVFDEDARNILIGRLL